MSSPQAATNSKSSNISKGAARCAPALVDFPKRSSIFHIGHLERLQALQKFLCCCRIELRIARFDAQEKAPARHLLELRYVEDGMIGHWQAVEHQHGDQTGERADQHRH